MGYVMRNGRRIEVETLPSSVVPKKHRPFEYRWVKLPRHWISGLARSNSASTFKLAHIILIEMFKDRRQTGWVTLSTEVTGMPRQTKIRAVRELVELGLIEAKWQARRALRVRVIHHDYY